MGYYVYSEADKSIQRYAVMPARPVSPQLPAEAAPTPGVEEPAEQPENSNGTGIDPIIFYAACGAAVLLLIALIAVIVKHSNEEKQRRERLARRRAQREKERSEAKASVEE